MQCTEAKAQGISERRFNGQSSEYSIEGGLAVDGRTLQEVHTRRNARLARLFGKQDRR